MNDEFQFLIPFSKDTLDDGWRLYFPFREVHHMGLVKNFTRADGEEMVSHFKIPTPDYKLPVNERHDDSAGIYGFIGDMRVAEHGVEWLPDWRDGAVKDLQDKGYLYASPEVVFFDYKSVGGDVLNNVALGMAITPRPRLGAATLVFEDGDWVEPKENPEARMDKDEKVALSEDEVRDIAEKAATSKFGEWILSLLSGKRDQGIDNSTGDGDDEGDGADEAAQKFAEDMQAKDAEIVLLNESIGEKDKEIAEYTDEIAKRASEQALAERELKLVQFSELASEIAGLPEDPSEFAEVLIWLEDKDDSEDKVNFNRVVTILKTLGNREAMAALFAENGNEGRGESDDGKIERLVKEKVATGMTKGEAYTAVFGENPELYTEYDRNNTKNVSTIDTIEEV